MAFTKIAGPGITTTDNYRVGVITATLFVGDGSSLTGVASTERIITGTAATFTSLVDINGDLDVDGKTDLDDLSVAGSTTVARGDLLESAGDGTAKPQSDDIVRSKTVAKITSTTSTATYADGSKAYPCALMAC